MTLAVVVVVVVHIVFAPAISTQTKDTFHNCNLL